MDFSKETRYQPQGPAEYTQTGWHKRSTQRPRTVVNLFKIFDYLFIIAIFILACYAISQNEAVISQALAAYGF